MSASQLRSRRRNAGRSTNGVYNVDPSVVQGQVNARWQNSASEGASMIGTTG